MLHFIDKNAVEEFSKLGHSYVEIPNMDLDPVNKHMGDNSYVDSNNSFETGEQLKQEKKHEHNEIPNSGEIRYLTNFI